MWLEVVRVSAKTHLGGLGAIAASSVAYNGLIR